MNPVKTSLKADPNDATANSGCLLLAGNVVMVKHAGGVPQCALAFEQLWREAGAPAGAYTNRFISYDEVNRVIDDSRIEGVALAGNVEAGWMCLSVLKPICADPLRQSGQVSHDRPPAATTIFPSW